VDLSRYFDYEQRGTPDAGEAARKTVFLARATRADWERLAACCSLRRFRAREVVVREGERAQSLYIVARGSLEVRRGDKRIAQIPEGSVFGEQAFFDGEPRSASVVAVSNGELLELGAADLEQLAARDPQLARAVLFDLGRILSLRLRAATDLAALVRR
jgi:CRP/FNR family transcriptional regulator, cyclic AMP receptor protein